MDSRPRTSLDRKAFLIAVVAIVSSIGYWTSQAIVPYVVSPIRPVRWDLDWYSFDRMLSQVHGFSDTLKWWTGSWPHPVAYWRPLSSYAIWGMGLIWPTEYMLPRQIIMVASHLLFTLLAGLLLWRLTGRRWLTWITIWLFAGFRPFPISWAFSHGQLTVARLLANPKNLPDTAMSIMVAGSLLLLAKGKWPASLVLAIMAVGFKETGIAAWPLALVMLLWIDREKIGQPGYVLNAVRRNRVGALIWALALVLFVLARSHAVGIEIGMRWNVYIVLKTALFFGGPIVGELAVRNWSPVIIGGLVVGTGLALRRFGLLAKFIGLIVALAIGVLIDTRFQGTTWDVSAARLFGFDLDLPEVIAVIIWLYIAIKGVRDWRTIAFAFAMSFMAGIPAMSTWAGAHSRYLAAFFLEVAVAAALCEVGRDLFGARARWRIFSLRKHGKVTLRT
ncbi:MAG TPA: hypothetical protein VFI02_19575 [Armatimonadota bacterium]|nr:hypothetical protein [Armatimonadota bacterium]